MYFLELLTVLDELFEEVEALDFYRNIFPLGELDGLNLFTKGKYTGIAVEITNEYKPNGSQRIKRYSVTDEFDVIKKLISSNNFCIMSPISYLGKSRISQHAKFLYALCVELDNLQTKDGEQTGLDALISQWSNRVHWIPQPTYTIASGNGVHLYYVFDKPIPLYSNYVKCLANYKRELTTKIWNRHVTVTHLQGQVQYESLFQGFRMVGTITKRGDRVRAFKTGETVSIEYMSHFTDVDLSSMSDDNRLSLEECKIKYPEWYEQRIVNNDYTKKTWVVKRDLYDWWKRRILSEAIVGHRYYCLMCLCVYAIKCDIDRNELERDCFQLLDVFEERTVDTDNHFTHKDVLDALQIFDDKDMITYPINSISNRSGLHIKKNKRNYRRRITHLKIARAIQEINDEANGTCWRNMNGRPTAQSKVEEWRVNNPTKRKVDCVRALGLDKKTVYKWWGE